MRRDSPQWELKFLLKLYPSTFHVSMNFSWHVSAIEYLFPWLLREAQHKTAVHPLAGLGYLPFWLAVYSNVFQMRTECWNTSANV